MNSNLKNAAITLLMAGTASGIVAGIGYGINKELKKDTTEVVITDPQKAEQAIEKEGLFNKTMFEVKQKIGNLFKKEELKPTAPTVVDYSALCYQIADYYQTNQKALMEIDSLYMAEDVDSQKIIEIISNLNKKSDEIKQTFKDFKTDNPATLSATENLEKEFLKYEMAMEEIRRQYVSSDTLNK